MNDHPLVSVIIPYFNTGKLVEEAIASVRRQDYAPLEIILVDDGSADDIAQRAARMEGDIRYLRLEMNKGPAAARNHGLKHATGEIIAFLDADDLWPDGKLKRQVARMQENQILGVVTGYIQYQWIGIPPEPRRANLKETQISELLGAAIMRRWVFDTVGLFDESLRLGEDVDWSLRMHEREVPVVLMNDVTLIYRRHGGNMTFNVSMKQSNLALVLKRSIDRRKTMHGKAVGLRTLSEVSDAS